MKPKSRASVRDVPSGRPGIRCVRPRSSTGSRRGASPPARDLARRPNDGPRRAKADAERDGAACRCGGDLVRAVERGRRRLPHTGRVDHACSLSRRSETPLRQLQEARRPEGRAPRPRQARRRGPPPPRPASAAGGRDTRPAARRALRVLSVPLSSSSGSTIEPERPGLDRVDVEVRLAPGVACEG